MMPCGYRPSFSQAPEESREVSEYPIFQPRSLAAWLFFVKCEPFCNNFPGNGSEGVRPQRNLLVAPL